MTLSPSLQEAEAAAELAVDTMHQMDQVSSMHSVSLLPWHGSSLVYFYLLVSSAPNRCMWQSLLHPAGCIYQSSLACWPGGLQRAALHGILPDLAIKQPLLPGMQVSTATRSLQQELANRDSTIKALEAQVAQLQASARLPG